VVLLIALGALISVVYSSLAIVRDSQRETVEISNRQVSNLISKSILSQVADYRRSLQHIFSSWQQHSTVAIDSAIFPDFVWIQISDLQGKPQYNWSEDKKLQDAGLNREMLLGFKKAEDLVQDVKSQSNATSDWVIFNSTIQPLFPTLILGVLVKKDGAVDPTHVMLAEVHAEKLFSNVQTRSSQQLILLDAHQNVLLSTRRGWDPSEFVLDDAELMETISSLRPGENRFSQMLYKDRGEQATSIFKYREGGGLSLVLQESTAELHASEARIRTQSLLIALIVMIITVNLIILFANTLISPLSQLMKLMEKAGKGEFSGKIKVKSKDEIGRLAQMFNKMTSELREREEEIEGAKTKLIQSEKMSAFGQMSAGIAHEVKNPLAGILGYAQMTKKKLPPEAEVLPYLDIIEKETVRCKEIVENLMKFARQEKAVMGRIDLNKTVKDSIRLVEHQISISGIKLVQVFAMDGAPIWFKGNANQIQQVLMNIMLNAQQAMENKGALTVSTHYSPENQKALIIISDTGCGMTAEVKHRIFEPFYTTKGVGKGTGLGLAVSLGIVKDHGGSIDVESEVGKGTTFTISLPIEGRVEGDSTDAAPPAPPASGTGTAAA